MCAVVCGVGGEEIRLMSCHVMGVSVLCWMMARNSATDAYPMHRVIHTGR